jgi:hypothetical protein
MRILRLLQAVLAIFTVALLPGISVAEDIYIAAADTSASHNLSLNPITVVSDWLRGIDCANEWVEYEFDLTGFGVNESRLTVMGADGVPFSIRMTVTGKASQSVQTTYFNFTGSGWYG